MVARRLCLPEVDASAVQELDPHHACGREAVHVLGSEHDLAFSAQIDECLCRTRVGELAVARNDREHCRSVLVAGVFALAGGVKVGAETRGIIRGDVAAVSRSFRYVRQSDYRRKGARQIDHRHSFAGGTHGHETDVRVGTTVGDGKVEGGGRRGGEARNFGPFAVREEVVEAVAVHKAGAVVLEVGNAAVLEALVGSGEGEGPAAPTVPAQLEGGRPAVAAMPVVVARIDVNERHQCVRGRWVAAHGLAGGVVGVEEGPSVGRLIEFTRRGRAQATVLLLLLLDVLHLLLIRGEYAESGRIGGGVGGGGHQRRAVRAATSH